MAANELENGSAQENEDKGRILGIVLDEMTPGTPAQRLGAVLNEEGYQVTWITSQEVLQGQKAFETDAVVIDAANTRVDTLCQRLKSPPDGAGQTDVHSQNAPILALIGAQSDQNALCDAGVDDFLSENATDAEIKARFSLAVRLGRLQRELQSTREELSRQVQVDDLSGALNRRYFFQAAYRECSRARRYGEALSCLMVDIDHFNLYNTTFGYACGDFILREIATILKNSVRDTDLVARFGGSKFVVLLTHTDTEGAVTVRQKIEDWVKGGYFVWQHQRLPVTVSIGEAERVPGRSRQVSEEFEEDNTPLSTREDVAELLEDADSALYIAKKGARFPTFVETPAEQQQG
ncbi:MAG TPA: diguanylate cyclase [Abditibacteriaceae bacterium]|jgi:diguanylate cyclase (GGDEF)-like protein